MLKKILIAFAVAIFSMLPVSAQNSVPGVGWNQSGQVVTNDMPFLVTALQSSMSQERQLSFGTGFGAPTDNGANSTYVINLSSTLQYLHGTGATTQQSLANAVHNFAGAAADDIWYYDGTNVVRLPKGLDGQVVGIDPVTHHVKYISPAGSGTVTSVGLSLPSFFALSGTPVTGAGTLTGAYNTGLTANFVLGTDSLGNAGLLGLTAAHIPNLSAAKITSGNLAKAQHATTAVFNDQSNVYTGTFTQDHGASTQTLVVPKKTIGATVGEVSVDTDDFAWRGSVGTNKAAKQATTVSAGTGLTGGGDLSANRTIALTTPVAAANGGTGLGAPANGTILIGNGSGYTAIGPGSAGQVPVSNGTTFSMGTVGGGFGGNAADGAITISGATGYTAPIQKNASTFTVNASQTLTCTGSPTIINATGAVTVNGTITVAAGSGYKGGANTPIAAAYGDGGQDGNGPGGGMGGRNHFTSPGTIGGGGGAFGADGGNPNSTASGAWPGGGKAYATNLLGGSGGGGATYTTLGSMAAGGGGGSLVIACIGAFSLPSGGVINAPGSAGVGATSGAGPGGGSGGMVFIASQTSISHATGSTINVSGGAGGTASTTAHGGGGAGGRLYRWTQGTVTSTGTFTATGGAAGGTGATAGGTGTATTIAGTPNLPLLTWTFDQGGLNEIEAIRKWTIAFKELRNEPVNPLDVTIDGRDVVRVAAQGDLAKFALYTNPQPLDQGVNTVLVIGDHVKGNEHAA